LDNKCPDFSGNGPDDISGQANSVVRNHDSISVVTFAQAFQRDDAMAAPTEGIFKRVGDEFVYNKPDREGYVDPPWSRISAT
jgi:hypothetical protein